MTKAATGETQEVYMIKVSATAIFANMVLDLPAIFATTSAADSLSWRTSRVDQYIDNSLESFLPWMTAQLIQI